MKNRLSDVNVKVIDITGRTIIEDSFNAADLSQNAYQFNISGYNNGVYYLMIESEGINYTEKLLKY